MLQKTKTYTKQFMTNMGDIRFVGQVVLAIIVLLASWSTVSAIQTNYELQKQVSELEQKVEISRLEAQNLRLKNQYLETDTFLELAARRQFGRAAPGEKVLLVPKDVALAYTVTEEDADLQATVETNKPAYQQNLEDWSNFFFRNADIQLNED